MSTAAFITLGCRINQYETEAIRERVLDLGYREVPPDDPADVYVVNTCSVTSTSGSKSRRQVLRAARTNPRARIVVVGCSTPGEKEQLRRIPQVALVAGHEEKTLVAPFLAGAWAPGDPVPDEARDIFGLEVSRFAGRTRAHVKAQDGCNGFCSFCVIPFLRGRSRSRPPAAVVAEVGRLVDRGFREVVVTGVHLQDYGEDHEPGSDLGALVEQVAEVPGLERLRLSSIGPRAFDRRLLDALDHPVVCPHFHIPLQAGSDTVLRRMRRDYTVEAFQNVVQELERRLGNVAITTDVITAHPGERPEDFEATLRTCREIGFAKIHVFPYSEREGTLAAKMRRHVDFEDVDPEEVRRRARALRELASKLGLEYRRRFVGTTVEVLVEGTLSAETPTADGGPAGEASLGALEPGGSTLEGFTERYVRVRFASPSIRARSSVLGTIQPVRVLEAAPGDGHVVGELAGALAGV